MTRPDKTSSSAGGRRSSVAGGRAAGRRGAVREAGADGQPQPQPQPQPAETRAGAGSRAERAAERRAAIVEAALSEFIARGFAATRLDDIAERAGVAKGTIYLHFKDKESMFEELIRTAIVPLVSRIATPPAAAFTGTVRDIAETFARTFLDEVAATRRSDIVRLILAEGPRFPAIAEFYYREVVSRGLAGMRFLLELGIARGEIRNRDIARLPQLLIAPALVAVVWRSLFETHAPLDAADMLRVHLDLIFGERSPP